MLVVYFGKKIFQHEAQFNIGKVKNLSKILMNH